jgi:uncharacterized damage-inducible protein DinB
MPIRDALLTEFDHEMATTRRLLERLPDDRLSWKPHDKSMSLGGLATHLANLPIWGITILSDDSYDIASGPPFADEKRSRAEILAAFDDLTRRARVLMDKTDAEYQGVWSLRRGDQEVFSLPRVTAFRSFVMNHIIHHRGQLSVYLRMNDVPVPAIYGPTADEA